MQSWLKHHCKYINLNTEVHAIRVHMCPGVYRLHDADLTVQKNLMNPPIA